MTASLETFVVAGLFGAAAVLAALVAAGLVAWHLARRRWRVWRNRAAARTLASAWALTSSLEVRRLLAGDLSGLSSLRVSRRLWVAVDAAQQGVDHAEAAGASVGDLPALSRRLREVATDVDRVVRLDAASGHPGRRVPDEVRHQVADVMTAARDIQVAAAAAVSDVAAPRARSLAADADQELRALAAGLERSQQLAE